MCCRAQLTRQTVPLQELNTAKMTSKANKASAATPYHATLETPSSLVDHDLKDFNARQKFQKPLKFHLALLSILLMVFIVSIDATALAVVIPVSPPPAAQPELATTS